jgi:hypothetical protein
VITEEIHAVPVKFCEKSCGNVSLRLQACIDVEGKAFDHTMENRH